MSPPARSRRFHVEKSCICQDLEHLARKIEERGQRLSNKLTVCGAELTFCGAAPHLVDKTMPKTVLERLGTTGSTTLVFKREDGGKIQEPTSLSLISTVVP
jgi:hypothetical protein